MNKRHKKLTIPLDGSTQDLLYYGTTLKKSPSIIEDGIVPGKKGYVELKKTKEEALKLAKRYHSRYPIVLAVRASAMFEDGYIFKVSAKGTFSCRSVPTEYIDIDPDDLSRIMIERSFKINASLGIDTKTKLKRVVKSQENNRRWFGDTLARCRKDSSLAEAVEYSARHGVIYDGNCDVSLSLCGRANRPHITVSDRNIIDEALHYARSYPYKKTTVTGFLQEDAPKNPDRFDEAVKDSLYCCTTLYRSLERSSELGVELRRKDRTSYVRDIVILKDIDNKTAALLPEERNVIDVVVCYVPSYHERDRFFRLFSYSGNKLDFQMKNERFKEDLYRRKIHDTVCCASVHGTDNLIVSSWGSGYYMDFITDCDIIARIYKEELEAYGKSIDSVCFALDEGYDSDIGCSFRRVFHV